MNSFSSLSTGCFVHKPSQKVKRQVPSFDRLEGETNRGFKARYEAFVECSSKAERLIQSISASINQDIVDEVFSFISSSISSISPSESASKLRQHVRVRGLPTAALHGGISQVDQQGLFEQLLNDLKKRAHCLCVSLSAEDCPNMKSLMKKFVSQVMIGYVDGDSEEDELKLKKSQHNMSRVVSWYKEMQANEGEGQQCTPIVIILKNLENFLSPLLQDFIEICNHFCDSLPLVFVFGLSTGSSALERILSQSVISLLCIKEFRRPPAIGLLDNIVDKLLINPQFPFHLGFHPLHHLLEHYKDHNFSFQTLNRSVKFAILEHFSKMPISLLCRTDVLARKSKRNFQIGLLSKHQLESIRSLKSFQRHVDSLNASDKTALLGDDSCLKNKVAEFLSNIQSFSENYYIGLKCLCHILGQFPQTKLGSTLHELCLASCKSDLSDHAGYGSFIRLLRQTSEVNLTKTLELCLAELDRITCISNISIIKARKESIAALCEEIKTLKESGNAVQAAAKPAKKVKIMATETTIQRKLKLTDRLREAAAGRQREPKSQLDQIRTTVSGYLDDWFSSSLRCLSCLSLHEAFCYKSKAFVQRINPSIRSALHLALSQPESHFGKQVSGGKTSAENALVIDSSLSPDICIAYKLYLECGKLINLYDWLQAFASVVEPHDRTMGSTGVRKRGRPRKRKLGESSTEADKETLTHSRFIRAVAELQFMGFIKPTKRKTDHVQRMTWCTS
eukprot:m.220549 g.220549  ORF g.220549 m.220549 type:complete len:735 (+) comp39945_c0_seq17:20-2224(+)